MTPEIILGPPGTGKTTTLLNIVDSELALGTPPDRIGFVTFTRRAAQEAQERACKKFGLVPKQLPYFRTLHSLCFQALGLVSADVLEGDQLVAFGDWIGVKVTGRWTMEEGTAFGFEVGERCLHMENLSRVTNTPLRQLYDSMGDDGLNWAVVERVSRGLAEWKAKKHVYDYTDMLRMFANSSYNANLDVLIVDEAQDLSMLQWDVVWALAKSCRRVVVAGDDDQAIYRWAGAAVDYFVRMGGDVRVLGQSWRVPAAVQDIAMGCVSGIRDRRDKTWAAREGVTGEARRISTLDELTFTAGEDLLILARNTCFLRDDAMPLLRSLGIVYEFRGAPSVRETVIDSILRWETLRRGGSVSVDDARRLYELLTTGTGVTRGHKKLPGFPNGEQMVTMSDLRASGGLLTDSIWHEALDRITPEERAYMVKALSRGEKLTKRPTVRLSTIHGSKGGEAEHVVLLRDMAWRTYREGQQLPDDEARVWYVGATRAKSTLSIVAPQTRRAYEI